MKKNFILFFILFVIILSIILYFNYVSATNNKIKNIAYVDMKSTPSTDIKNVQGNIYIRLFKHEHLLEIWMENENNTFDLYKTYKICTFSGGLGTKKKEGDLKSPEGFYATNKTLLNPNSQYHLSFNIGYPNAYDKAHGYTGSFIMIHGSCVSIGCYAMTDPSIEEIYALVEQALQYGQNSIPVHIFPFKMTNEQLKQYVSSEYYPFWNELKPAYDYFEENKKIPVMEVKNKKYVLVN